MLSNTKWTLALLLSAGLTTAACGGKDDEESADFEEAIPSSEMLAVETSEAGSGGGGGDFATAEGALVGQPSCIANHMHTVAERVNSARERVHTLMDRAMTEGADRSVELRALTCKAWTFEGDNGNEWQLRSCLVDRAANRYAFGLGGRAAGSDAEYMPVAGGHSVVLPRSADNKKRGQGIMGFNFDNLNSLTGQGPTGKAAIAFRAAGRYRQMAIGLKDFQAVGADAPYSAVYHYGRAKGTGGFFKFKFSADIFSTDADGKPVGACQGGTPDQLVEKGRIGVSWNSAGKARMAGVICDGTVADQSAGTDGCVAFRQCWEATGDVSFEDFDADSGTSPAFEATACPTDSELIDPVSAPPTEAEVDGSGLTDSSDEDNPGIEGVTTPSTDPGLEAE